MKEETTSGATAQSAIQKAAVLYKPRLATFNFNFSLYLVLQFDVCTSWAFPSSRWWWLNDTDNLTAVWLVVRYDRNCDGTCVRNSLHHPADLLGKHPIRFWKYLCIDKFLAVGILLPPRKSRLISHVPVT
jgi:hypothetical protein